MDGTRLVLVGRTLAAGDVFVREEVHAVAGGGDDGAVRHREERDAFLQAGAALDELHHFATHAVAPRAAREGRPWHTHTARTTLISRVYVEAAQSGSFNENETKL